MQALGTRESYISGNYIQGFPQRSIHILTHYSLCSAGYGYIFIPFWSLSSTLYHQHLEFLYYS